jgi:hypothetical protein
MEMKMKTARSALPKREVKYKEYIARIRELRNRGAAEEIAAMRLIVEFEKATYAWKEYPSTTFESVIRDEHLCTVARFRSFKKAVSDLTKLHIDRLGVAASCLIAMQSKGSRFRLLNAALQFRSRHEIEPTYQFVSRMIRGRQPKLSRPTYGEQSRYIAVLKDVITKLGGKIPPMEVRHA